METDTGTGTEKYQAHCRVCFAVLTGNSAREAIRLVEEHEALRNCVRPIYDAAKGYWVR